MSLGLCWFAVLSLFCLFVYLGFIFCIHFVTNHSNACSRCIRKANDHGSAVTVAIRCPRSRWKSTVESPNAPTVSREIDNHSYIVATWGYAFAHSDAGRIYRKAIRPICNRAGVSPSVCPSVCLSRIFPQSQCGSSSFTACTRSYSPKAEGSSGQRFEGQGLTQIILCCERKTGTLLADTC